MGLNPDMLITFFSIMFYVLRQKAIFFNGQICKADSNMRLGLATGRGAGLLGPCLLTPLQPSPITHPHPSGTTRNIRKGGGLPRSASPVP